jgi:hypothetical protein
MRAGWMCGVFVAAVWLGCNASGTTSGGSPTASDACDATNGGHTWTDLYTCYFGPGAKTSCVGQDFCHGGPQMLGALNSPFYVCGATRESCYEGFVKSFSGCPDGGVADAEADGPLEATGDAAPGDATSDAPVVAPTEAGSVGSVDAGRCSVGVQAYAWFFGDVRGSSITGFHNMPYSFTSTMQYTPGSTGPSFTQADLDRISAWINEGAQDN